MYKWFVYKYYRITGTANQICSESIWGRRSFEISYTHSNVTFVFIRHISLAPHFHFIYLRHLCARWMKAANNTELVFLFFCSTQNLYRDYNYLLVVRVAWKDWDVKRDNMLNSTLCVCAGLCAVSGVSALCLLKLAWPLNIIKLALAAHAFTRTHLNAAQERGKWRRRLQTHTHTLRHKSFSQRGAKSIPNTPHRFYLHGFDVSLMLSRELSLLFSW